MPTFNSMVTELNQGFLQMSPVSAFCREVGWHECSTSQLVSTAHSDWPFLLLVQWPWLLTMKLEPDTPIASFCRQKPLWCHAEHTPSEYAILMLESPPDCLTPAVSTNTLRLCRDSFWVVTYDTHIKSNPKKEIHSCTSLISEWVIFKLWPLPVEILYWGVTSTLCAYGLYIYKELYLSWHTVSFALLGISACNSPMNCMYMQMECFYIPPLKSTQNKKPALSISD